MLPLLLLAPKILIRTLYGSSEVPFPVALKIAGMRVQIVEGCVGNGRFRIRRQILRVINIRIKILPLLHLMLHHSPARIRHRQVLRVQHRIRVAATPKILPASRLPRQAPA